jgi:VanZ family protein
MGFVFLMSTELGSSANTGRFLVPLLRWIHPTISAAAIEHVHFLLRKAAHVTEYAVLALLMLRAIRIATEGPAPLWSWRLAGLALVGSALYATMDELHQLLVATRGPSMHDVLIDTCGAALGLVIAFVWTTNQREVAAA